MKIPKKGNFIQEEGSICAKNDVTEEEVIFVADESQNLCFRSMTEDDVHKVMDAYGVNSRKRKMLKKILAKKDSQFFNFVLEEMNVITEGGERKIVGDCQIDEEGKTFVQLYIKNYNKDTAYAYYLRARVLIIICKILKELCLDSVPEISRVSKQ